MFEFYIKFAIRIHLFEGADNFIYFLINLFLIGCVGNIFVRSSRGRHFSQSVNEYFKIIFALFNQAYISLQENSCLKGRTILVYFLFN